jgi:hypothetical protein
MENNIEPIKEAILTGMRTANVFSEGAWYIIRMKKPAAGDIAVTVTISQTALLRIRVFHSLEKCVIRFILCNCLLT